MSIQSRLQELKIDIPTAPIPVAAYVPAVVENGFAFTAGQLPMADGVLKYSGKVGVDLTEQTGYDAARLCTLNCLAVLRSALGDLDRIERIVKLTVFVNSAPDFSKTPLVANGGSELLVTIFGDAGRHARSAVGVASLPLNAATEVEMIVKVRS